VGSIPPGEKEVPFSFSLLGSIWFFGGFGFRLRFSLQSFGFRVFGPTSRPVFGGLFGLAPSSAAQWGLRLCGLGGLSGVWVCGVVWVFNQGRISFLGNTLLIIKSHGSGRLLSKVAHPMA
jgi:hypothetical protein